MSTMRLLGLQMGLRDGLGTHVCSSELCLDVIFLISSHFGSFFSKNDQISLISMHPNLAFRSRGSSKLRFSSFSFLLVFLSRFNGV